MKVYKCDVLAQPSTFFLIYMDFDGSTYQELLAVHRFSLIFFDLSLSLFTSM